MLELLNDVGMPWSTDWCVGVYTRDREQGEVYMSAESSRDNGSKRCGAGKISTAAIVPSRAGAGTGALRAARLVAVADAEDLAGGVSCGWPAGARASWWGDIRKGSRDNAWAWRVWQVN